MAGSAGTFPQLAPRLHALARWVHAKVWAHVLAVLATDHDPETPAVDATYVRVYADGTRARGGYAAQAVGRSRRGAHPQDPPVDRRLRKPRALRHHRGERDDMTQAPALLPPGTGAHVVCDRGYDADRWREPLLAVGHIAVVPGRRSRRVQPLHDEHLNRSRHLF